MAPLHTIVQDGQNGVVLTVHVQPKASRPEYVGIHGDALKIRLAAPPFDGAANDELVRFLADCCAVPSGSISILAGAKSRAKRVMIQGVTAKTVLAGLMAVKEKRRLRGMKATRIGAIFGLLFLTACAGAHPVLYPNAHLQSVGKEVAD